MSNVRPLESNHMSIEPAWVTRGKTIRELITELRSFEDQEMEVRLSVDDGATHKCISLVYKQGGKAVLKNSERAPG